MPFGVSQTRKAENLSSHCVLNGLVEGALATKLEVRKDQVILSGGLFLCRSDVTF